MGLLLAVRRFLFGAQDTQVRYWPSCEACEGNMGCYSRADGYFMRCERCGNEQGYTAEEMAAMQPDLALAYPERRRRFRDLFGDQAEH